ncbi:hypothetical protein CALCODRAFT_359559 [Calocera cornea HHB12733]|uniref:Uncharacterized protein n=1 Tax=Calocera cornea HHB12733 TaxID=1353952 RepID=A0A165EM25_9BASI|nr:hypothetical protein CALCODRAFT_359559 [Calocera cornea HHB12733]
MAPPPSLVPHPSSLRRAVQPAPRRPRPPRSRCMAVAPARPMHRPQFPPHSHNRTSFYDARATGAHGSPHRRRRLRVPRHALILPPDGERGATPSFCDNYV